MCIYHVLYHIPTYYKSQITNEGIKMKFAWNQGSITKIYPNLLNFCKWLDSIFHSKINFYLHFTRREPVSDIYSKLNRICGLFHHPVRLVSVEHLNFNSTELMKIHLHLCISLCESSVGLHIWYKKKLNRFMSPVSWYQPLGFHFSEWKSFKNLIVLREYDNIPIYQ